MTGFGEATHLGENLQVSVTIRAVNGRHLEIRPHLPKEYFSLESEIKKIAQDKIGRATVDIFVGRKVFPGKKNINTSVNKEIARELFKSCEDLRKLLKISEPVSLTHLLRWSEIISLDINQPVMGQESKLILSLVADAIGACNKQRQREGKALAQELKRLLDLLEDLVEKMRPLAVPNQEQMRELLLQRWEKLKITGVDDSRLAQEVAIHLDRFDVTEELARLREHIAVSQKMLLSREVAGKKLEFFCQELLREVNTIGSKSQKPDLTHLVVECKGCIERLREQVQNVE